MTSPDHSISLIKQFETHLDAHAQAPNDATFEALHALIAPALSKGNSAFFDHLCTHATSSRSGELLPAFFSFMDRLTREGEIAASEASAPIPIQSACILAYLCPEDDSHNPRMLLGLEDLRKALALSVGVPLEDASLAPLALDLRRAKPSYELFGFCAMAAQFQSAGALPEEAFENYRYADPRLAPDRRWVALSASFAFPEGTPTQSASARIARAIGAGAVFQCSYLLDGQTHSAVIDLQGACDPFSCCAKAFEPEAREIAEDLKKIGEKFDLQKDILAILEPQAPLLAGVPLEKSELAGFGLSILHNDGDLIDALWLPPAPESLALAHALLDKAGISTKVSPVRAFELDANDARSFMAPGGPRPFDPFVWRRRVLGVDDTSCED